MTPAMATYIYRGSPKSSDWAGVTEGVCQGDGLVLLLNFRFCERRQEGAGSGPRGSGHYLLCIGSSWTHRYPGNTRGQTVSTPFWGWEDVTHPSLSALPPAVQGVTPHV